MLRSAESDCSTSIAIYGLMHLISLFFARDVIRQSCSHPLLISDPFLASDVLGDFHRSAQAEIRNCAEMNVDILTATGNKRISYLSHFDRIRNIF